jgi:oligogalacturonide lyase
MQAERVTQNKDANEQLLYYTAPGLADDETTLAFISDRTGHPNLFVRDLASGEESPLSFNEQGYLKSYQYFDGRPYEGFGRASPTMHPLTGELYYIQGREIIATNLEGAERWRVEYPADQMTAYTHVSADGSRLCVPTTDARALDGDRVLPYRPDFDIDQRVRDEDLSSYLRIYDSQSGELLHVERIPQSWITHTTYSPRPDEPDLMHYEYEWPADCGIRMLWTFDGKSHQPLRTEGDGRSRDDWVCHPIWERDGSAVLYHGYYKNGDLLLGRIMRDGTTTEVPMPMPSAAKRYGHFEAGPAGWMISDGYYQADGDSVEQRRGQWLSLVNIDWDSKQAQWTPLFRHGASWQNQDCHPHPIFNARGDRVYYTSDVDGKLAVYRVAVGQLIQ